MAENYLYLRFFQRLRQNRNRIGKRRLRDASNPLEVPVNLFIKDYRLDQDTFLFLCEELRPVVPPKKRRHQISLELEVLVTLSFLATGSYQEIVGKDYYAPQSQASVSRAIDRVIKGLNEIMSKFIQFPTDAAKRSKIKEGYQEKFHIPGVLGAIDGTHVKILRPTNHEENYFCRKGYHSINATMICDSDLRILAVCAIFGGATHDAHVWRSMALRPYVERLRTRETFWLLGDSAYPLRDYLMTPIANPEPGVQANYNDMHSAARNTIERCFGVLKNRWRCCINLKGLHHTPGKAGLIINACAVLHNIAVATRLPLPEDYDEGNANDEGGDHEVREEIDRIERQGLAAGQFVRNELMHRLNIIN